MRITSSGEMFSARHNSISASAAGWRWRQHGRPRLVAAPERECLQETIARFNHVGRTLHALLGQQRCLKAFAGGVSGMQALDVGATVDESEQAGGAACGDTESVDDPPDR